MINYIDNIHPLWSLPRPQFDDMGNPIVDGNGVQIDMQCTGCHAFPYIDPNDGVQFQRHWLDGRRRAMFDRHPQRMLFAPKVKVAGA